MNVDDVAMHCMVIHTHVRVTGEASCFALMMMVLSRVKGRNVRIICEGDNVASLRSQLYNEDADAWRGPSRAVTQSLADGEDTRLCSDSNSGVVADEGPSLR